MLEKKQKQKLHYLLIHSIYQHYIGQAQDISIHLKYSRGKKSRKKENTIEEYSNTEGKEKDDKNKQMNKIKNNKQKTKHLQKKTSSLT
jgi:ATP-dependent protease ClpP protease subunit